MGMVEASGLHKSYRMGSRRVRVLDDVSVEVPAGEMVAVMGPSGCGKTTLLNCLSGLDDIDRGSIMVDGRPIHRLSDRKRTKHRAQRMGFVFQAFNLVPVLTAQRNVEMPLQLAGVNRRVAAKRASDALAAVGLADRAEHKPTELSGGQQQRVAIARALVNEPAVVWADEPTGNLDSNSGQEVLDIFRSLNRDQGVTFMIVTHDQRVATAAHRTIKMDSGRILG